MAEDAPRDRFERLRALRSAWSVLAAAGCSAEASRAALAELAQAAPDASAEFDMRLDLLEREIREIAPEIPIDRLRATLAERVVADRRGVRDLLDLVLGAELVGLEGIHARIPTLDVLITLLCTDGNPHGPLHDPVLLTDRLRRLCERSPVDYDARLPELEAEFYAVANLSDAELSNEDEQRTLRRKKMELGSNYFAPRLLRAIVTYNAALMRRTVGAPAASGSLFEAPALPKLAGALRRRAAGQPPALDPIDRIAWCLDLNDLTGVEREVLLSESTGRREGLEGTTVLLGLLCRSAVVLDEEFPAIGIATHELTGAWSGELADLLQQEVNRRIASDYSRASVLTELKSRYLTVSHSRPNQSRIRRASQPQTTVDEHADERTAQSAKPPAKAKREPVHATVRWREWPWVATARVGAVGLFAAIALVALIDALVWSEGRVGGDELEQLSPYLSHGKRSDAGSGTAFRGTLDDAWFALAPARQQDAADALVAALRQRGARDIMVYDEDGHLRIQALGVQPGRLVR